MIGRLRSIRRALPGADKRGHCVVGREPVVDVLIRRRRRDATTEVVLDAYLEALWRQVEADK
jgi:hypothetical protein